MKISKPIVQEAIRAMDKSEPMVVTLLTDFQKVRDENEHLAEFIDAALDIWKDNPPPTLDDQLSTLFIDLVLLADMFRRQEEVDNLSKNLGE